MKCKMSGVRYVILLSLFFLQGCQDYQQEFEIIRNPFIEISIEDSVFTITDYNVVFLGQTAEFNDVDSAYEVYQRVVLYGSSHTSGFEKIQVTFDIHEVNNLVNTYTFNYSRHGGIKEITWTVSANLTDFNSFYSCENEQDGSFITVTKQSRLEKIISGIFYAVLCDTKSPEKTIAVTGEFNDISYE